MSLDFQYHHATTFKKNEIGAPRITWQFVFKDGGVPSGGCISGGKFGALSLELWNALIPSTDLLGACVRHKCLHARPNVTWLRLCKAIEIRFPTEAVLAVHCPVTVRGIEGTP